MKFDLGAQTTPARKAEGAGDDLGGLIMQLIAAAEPLKEEFSGAGRAAFDSFTSDADAITEDLDSSLAVILGGRSGTTTWFDEDDTESADNARLEAAIAQRNAEVNAAMNDFTADGVAEHYRAVEQRWHSAATQVQQIITLLRTTTMARTDDAATTALPQARAAVQDIA